MGFTVHQMEISHTYTVHIVSITYLVCANGTFQSVMFCGKYMKCIFKNTPLLHLFLVSKMTHLASNKVESPKTTPVKFSLHVFFYRRWTKYMTVTTF